MRKDGCAGEARVQLRPNFLNLIEKRLNILIVGIKRVGTTNCDQLATPTKITLKLNYKLNTHSF